MSPVQFTALAVYQDAGRDFITACRSIRNENHALFFGLTLTRRANDKTQVATAYLHKDGCFRHAYVVRAVRVRPVPRLQIDGERRVFASTSVCVRIGKCLRSHYALVLPTRRKRTNKNATRTRKSAPQIGSYEGGGGGKNTKKTLATDIIKNRTGVLPRQTNRLNAQRITRPLPGIRGPRSLVWFWRDEKSSRVLV